MELSEKDKEILQRGIKVWEMPYSYELEERELYNIPTLDYLTGGLIKGTVVLIAGEPGAGKTTFATQTINEIVKDNQRVFVVEGEGTLEEERDLDFRQLAETKDNAVYVPYTKDGQETVVGEWKIKKEYVNKAREILKNKLFYYNVRFGMNIGTITETFDTFHRLCKIDYFTVDNMSQIDIMTENEIKEARDNVEILRRFAVDNKVCVVLLAHYRKPMDTNMVRRKLWEIMGTSAYGQKASSALNVMRIDNIDKTTSGYKSLKKICSLNNYEWDDNSQDKPDCIIEVLKSRANKLGFVCLKFDMVTRTYKEFRRTKPLSVINDTQKSNVTELNQIEITEIDTNAQSEIDKIFNVFPDKK